MKLPNAERAVVPSRKLTHYLLSTTHRDGQHKGEFFRHFGFSPDDWQALASALLNHARNHEVVGMVSTPFGKNYVVEGPCPHPTVARRMCVWFGSLPTVRKPLPWPRRIRWMPDAMIKELDSVVLTTDLPEHGLTKGDIGTVVLVHEGGRGCTVEFMTLAGHTLAVVTLLASQIRTVAKDEIAHARHVAVAA